MKILYFNNSAFGGLAQYAHYQANALVEEGCEVDFLCPPNYGFRSDAKYTAIPLLSAKAKRSGKSKWARLRGFYREVTSDIKALADHLKTSKYEHVLFGSYLEYFSPFWVESLVKLRSEGIAFGSVVHDPVRDTKLGPGWWHRYSVKRAYDFLDMVFLHQELGDPDTGMPENIERFIIPHGPYPVEAKTLDKDDSRAQLGLPREKTVLLSFGHIRDNKNLKLSIQALKDHPDVHLVVAGQSLNETQTQPEAYQALAERLGIADQISWFTDYIPDDDVATYFSAADGILLTYGKGFRSASGVLNLASSFEKPCIASAGPSPLQELVQTYKLGVWVDPDDDVALSAGMRKFLETPPQPDWCGYQRDNTWERNARTVRDAFLNARRVS